MSKAVISTVYRLLEFLKKNTDQKHPMTQAALRKTAGDELSEKMMGDKGTFSRRLRDLADTYNKDENGKLLPKEKWKILYPGYDKDDSGAVRNGKICYVHDVSDYEMDFILKQIRNSHCFTSEEKKSLSERLTNALCSKYYVPSENGNGALIREFACEEKNRDYLEETEEKIRTIREHILSKKMLELRVYAENPDYPGKEKDLTLRVSPYRIFHKDGYFWLIGNLHERPKKDVPWSEYTDALSAFRVDKIHKMETACTPWETYIHWTMTKGLLPGQSYTRESIAQRDTKARYTECIKMELEMLDNSSEVELEHLGDLRLYKLKD